MLKAQIMQLELFKARIMPLTAYTVIEYECNRIRNYVLALLTYHPLFNLFSE